MKSIKVSLAYLIFGAELTGGHQDERYREQKQRICMTGIRQAFHMIEEHELQYETFIKAVQTSVSQTQVIE